MKHRVLVFSCPHEPFTKKGYLKFLKRVEDEFECDTVINLGDMTDNHTTSYHEHDPDGMSANAEYELTLKKLQKWYSAFPNMLCCIGNHDELPFRKARTHGLTKEFFKSYREMWKAPDTWYWHESFEVDGVLYEHGTGSSGVYAHKARALNNMQSTVIGHHHSNFGVEYIASNDKLIFGMGVGCGVDRKSYAMAYGKHFPRKPILGCGVVMGGLYAVTVPMVL